MKIDFKGAGLTEKHLLGKVLNYSMKFLEQPEQKASLKIYFLDKQQIRALNNEARDIDKETDVLSFQFLDYIEAGGKIDNGNPVYRDAVSGLVELGEIYLCRKIARRQAKEFGHSYRREISFLALHGLLHLLGYDHKNEEDERCMFAVQEQILGKLKIGRA